MRLPSVLAKLLRPVVAFALIAGFVSTITPAQAEPPTSPAAAPAEPRKSPRRITRAECQAHLEAMGKRIPAGFDAVIEPPFVVLGDGGLAKVKASSKRTVRWAVDMLRKDFFRDDPDKVLEVWLFDGKASYRKNTRKIFGDQPTTPFGYYSPLHGALIMNIATGGGTLVHEIVHPFVEANVEDCPAWINEGLGSLFEQCRQRDGVIKGSLNWRLDGLQRAITDDATIPITELVATSDAQFYGNRSGLHYAMARYLLYWLQEKGKLRTFWRDWLRTKKHDPTGVAALRRALGTDDLRAFQVKWQKWIAGRRR